MIKERLKPKKEKFGSIKENFIFKFKAPKFNFSKINKSISKASKTFSSGIKKVSIPKKKSIPTTTPKPTLSEERIKELNMIRGFLPYGIIPANATKEQIEEAKKNKQDRFNKVKEYLTPGLTLETATLKDIEDAEIHLNDSNTFQGSVEFQRGLSRTAKKIPFSQVILFLKSSNAIDELINPILEGENDYTFDVDMIVESEDITEDQYIILENEIELTKKELEKINGYYRDKRIKTIVLGSNKNAILYEGETFDKFREAYVLDKSLDLTSILWSDKISSLKITSNLPETLKAEAHANNQIFLFSEVGFTGRVEKISIPSKQFTYPINLKSSLELKSIIIPKDRNLKIIFNDVKDKYYTKTNRDLTVTKEGSDDKKGIIVSNYYIEAIEPNLDVITPLSVLDQNKEELSKIKNKLFNVIEEKQIKNNNLNLRENDIMNSMVNRLVNDIKKKRNSFLYEVNNIPM